MQQIHCSCLSGSQFIFQKSEGVLAKKNPPFKENNQEFGSHTEEAISATKSLDNY